MCDNKILNLESRQMFNQIIYSTKWRTVSFVGCISRGKFMLDFVKSLLTNLYKTLYEFLCMSNLDRGYSKEQTLKIFEGSVPL